jgi:sigma-54 dependent transcriptional regulator, flagellar regulatory protein
MTTHWHPPGDEVSPVPATRGLVDKLIPGASPPMDRLKRLVSTLAPADGPVLVTGPSGSGKELVAEALHRLSGRPGEFIAVNCAAIPAELLEGELFGTERGAYTGADRARAGLIEQAEGGTLFLDEIGDMPLQLQAKILRVLETRSLRRLGAAQPIRLDFRLVAATHRDLSGMVAAGKFREDLFYRLSVFPLGVPPLNARLVDLPIILERMLDEQAQLRPGQALPEFDTTALRALAAHDWPGNVRELKSVVMRACLLFAGARVSAREVRENLVSFASPATGDAAQSWPAPPVPLTTDGPESGNLHAALLDGVANFDLRGYLRDIEVALIEAALKECNNCVSHTADKLRLRRTTLIEKMRKYGIGRS